MRCRAANQRAALTRRDKVSEISVRRIAQAEERMTALRGEVRRVHEEIGDLVAKLADTDLVLLEPEP